MTSVKKCTNTNTIPGQSAFLASSSSPPSLASSKLDIVLSEQQPGLDNKNMAARHMILNPKSLHLKTTKYERD